MVVDLHYCQEGHLTLPIVNLLKLFKGMMLWMVLIVAMEEYSFDTGWIMGLL